MSPATLKYSIGKILTWVTATLTIAAILYNYAAWKTHDPQATTSFGASFSKQYAQYLGLDWKKAYAAMLDDLGARYIRINSYWNEVEQTEGVYTFTDIDWQLQEAAKRSAKVILVVGRRQPRWPECHDPSWVLGRTQQEQREKLLAYMKATILRYRGSSAIEAWQVENEPLLSVFGECPRMTRDELTEEIALVRSLDKRHVLITDSGELSTWRKTINAGDLFGTTMYRRTWTPHIGYASYWWVPAGAYRVKAYIWGRPIETVWNMELQVEPWFKGDPLATSLQEQEKTMTPDILSSNFDYALQSELPRAYVWGAEWWYWMKEKQGDGRYWEIAKKYIQ